MSKTIKTLNHVVKPKLERIERMYDADNDTIPGAPKVTYTDSLLASTITELLWAIERQQEEIDMLWTALRDSGGAI